MNIEGAEWRLFGDLDAKRFFGAKDGLAEILRSRPPLQLALEVHGARVNGSSPAFSQEAARLGLLESIQSGKMASEWTGEAASAKMVVALKLLTPMLKACGYTLRHQTAHKSLKEVLYVHTHSAAGACAAAATHP